MTGPTHIAYTHPHDPTAAMATTASQEAPAATAAYTYKPPTRAIFGEGDLVSFHKSKVREWMRYWVGRWLVGWVVG